MSIPNLLSLLRLVLVPVFAVVFFQPAPDAHRWAVLIYLTAFLTDVADGWIARHFNQITKLGRILDPLADKLMTFTVIICITADGIIPLWAVVVFFLKELTMAIGGYRSAIYQGRVAAASITIAAKQPNDWSKGIILCVIVEFYAILSLLASILLLMNAL